LELGAIIDRLLEQDVPRDVYVVSAEGRVLGHLSHRRLARLLLAEHRPVHTRRQIMERVCGGTAEELMEPHFVYAHPDEELEDVLHRLLEHEIEDMAVIDDLGLLVGAINLTEVLRDRRNETRR
jgi:CBS domain-containing protein